MPKTKGSRHSMDFERPLLLIESTSSGELQVNQEALDVLNSIEQTVVVVSIVGLYRTGKSYLMNRLAGKQTGFPLGSTIQSETKGIWMWCMHHPYRDDQTLVLLDTEGLGDVEKGDQAHDTWIFPLAILLSSTFVYNSMGTINNKALMNLHHVTELTKHIKVKSHEEGTEETSSEYIRFFPTFVWTVRDFTLELKFNGKEVTADEYLENSLRLVKGNSKHAAYSNGPRECIRNYFPTRKCFVFDQPASKEKLRIIEQLTDADLEPAFVQQTLEFCRYIFECSKEKTMTGGYKVTGQMLGNLVVTYVDAIRSGSVLCLENAVAVLSKIENSKAIEESFALYRELLGERVKLHTETQEELSSAHEGCLKEALQLFMKRSFKDEDRSFQRQLMERIKAEYDGKCSENAVLSQSHCTALQQQLWSQMDYESFRRPGGYADYRVQLDSIVQTYENTPGKVVQEQFVAMQKPVCLISSCSAGKPEVTQEALVVLNSIRQPVVVVSIVGMYHTGKSYLMNRLAGKQMGFALGSTIQSETKGIWMWCVRHPYRDDRTLVLLDTEGLGDVEKGDQAHDTWIFSLAILLSSTFVYNSMGTINNEAVMSLHHVTELTKHIKVKSHEEGTEETSSEYIRFFPTFVWTVRDFTLELKFNGKEVTADEYLENSLRLVKGNSPLAEHSNGPRKCIRNYFPTRKCFVFDQPASKKKLKRMEELTDAVMEPAFVQQTLEFCSYIFEHSKEKTMTGGYEVTGQMLGNLAVTYVDAIRSGSVPCLENAVVALSQIENSKAIEQSFALYRELLGERVKLHTETQEELSSAHEGCLKEALQLFMKRSFKDEDRSFQRQLMEQIKHEYDGKCNENAVLSQSHCTALLQQLWSQMDYESFMRPGGYADYRVQLDSIVQTYSDTPGKGVQAEQALEIFMKEKNDLGASILKADRNLTEQDKKQREEEARVEMEKFKAEVARRNQEDAVKRLEDAEKAHRENEQQLMDKLERERRAIIEENQRVLDQRLKEQRALISEGFEQRARMMEAQVQSLQRELAASKSRGGGGCVLL